jgi:glyoxylase-like metal-dependent hydrolase (beta-lactamase superfamily II)
MKIYHVTTGLLGVNTYFLVNEQTKNAILIDGGESYKAIKKTESDLGVKITTLLLTHAHFDHAGNAGQLQKDGVKVLISEIDAQKLSNGLNLASDFGRKFNSFVPDETLKDGQVLNIEDIQIKVIATPGHTDGSLTFMIGNNLFTGDTLFFESIGRTDFPTGNKTQLINSVKKLFALEGDYNVYPGHQEFTTLSHERENNFFVDYD